ncbi:MAG TPA: undecaprenyl-diphosphate phosphatase [Candidatus Binatia bacterium]|nr:undecaprenyl-diphosphate phosphatase [Candidatus Binatia bacterium]
MTWAQALVLGVVQGLTEFLPISSSGHLILVPYLFGWHDQGLAFDAAIHLGTIAALLAYFRRELLALVSGALSRRLGVLVILASVPAGVAGLALGPWIEVQLRSPLVVAASTALWGLVMLAADRRAPKARPGAGDALERVTAAQVVLVGCAQALALVPGTSRSGITITAGLLGGLDRATAARFSFLLAIPITTAAGALKMVELLEAGVPTAGHGPLLVAVLTAFGSGWAAIWFLVSYLKRRSLIPFVLYRLLLAAAILALTFRGV